jgi:uncharacterized protein YutE (UPF0331/DUF86 family)
MSDDTAARRMLAAWTELEDALRRALPVCSVAPPTQPSELLSALRINRSIGPEEEERISALRETRNRVAHAGEDPGEKEASSFEAEVEALVAYLRDRGEVPGPRGDACGE